MKQWVTLPEGCDAELFCGSNGGRLWWLLDGEVACVVAETRELCVNTVKGTIFGVEAAETGSNNAGAELD